MHLIDCRHVPDAILIAELPLHLQPPQDRVVQLGAERKEKLLNLSLFVPFSVREERDRERQRERREIER